MPLVARVAAEGRSLRPRARRALEVRAERFAEPFAAFPAGCRAHHSAEPAGLAGRALDADAPVLDGRVAARVVGPVAPHLLRHRMLGPPYCPRDPGDAVSPVQSALYREPVVVRERARARPSFSKSSNRHSSRRVLRWMKETICLWRVRRVGDLLLGALFPGADTPRHVAGKHPGTPSDSGDRGQSLLGRRGFAQLNPLSQEVRPRRNSRSAVESAWRLLKRRFLANAYLLC